MTSRVAEEARKLIGTPWRHRGRKPWAVDCLGLVVLSLRGAGIQVDDKTDYGTDPRKAGLQEGLRKRFGHPVQDWSPGDIALIRWGSSAAPSHVAIIGEYAQGGLSLIHCYNGCKVTEHRMTDKWKIRIVEVYRCR